MPKLPLWIPILVWGGVSLLPAQPFKADSQPGELYLIGRTESTADKKIVITAEHLLLSVDSAKLALRFPNRVNNTIGGENQQLLLLSGTIKNPQNRELTVNASDMAVLRVFGAAAGQTYHVETVVDADSLEHLRVSLKPGQSAHYTMVVRVPAERPALTMALFRRYGPIRRYDFGAMATRDKSSFPNEGLSVSAVAQATVGQVFDLDSLDLSVNSVREVAKVGGYASSEGKRIYAAEIRVTNRMLHAETWGWQHCTPELKDNTGTSIPWSRDMLDAQTAQTFSKELAAGETATVMYIFSSATRVAPASLTLTMMKSKRQVEIPLRPL